MDEEKQNKEDVKIKLNLDKLFTNNAPSGFQSKPIVGNTEIPNEVKNDSVKQCSSNSSTPSISQSMEAENKEREVQKIPEVKLKIKSENPSPISNTSTPSPKADESKPSLGLIIEEKVTDKTEPTSLPKGERFEVVGDTVNKKITDTVKLKRIDADGIKKDQISKIDTKNKPEINLTISDDSIWVENVHKVYFALLCVAIVISIGSIAYSIIFLTT